MIDRAFAAAGNGLPYSFLPSEFRPPPSNSIWRVTSGGSRGRMSSETLCSWGHWICPLLLPTRGSLGRRRFCHSSSWSQSPSWRRSISGSPRMWS